MKKILYICEAMGGGVKKHVLDLIKNIDKNEFEIFIIYSKSREKIDLESELKYLIDKNKINLIENNDLVRNINLVKDIKAFAKIVNIIFKIRPDIVHCHSSKAGALGRVAAKILFVKKIFYTPHAYSMQDKCITDKKRNFYRIMEMILSKYFTTLTINVSKGENEFAIVNKLDKPEKFSVVYNGIAVDKKKYNKEKIRKELGIKSDEIVIGVAARLDNQKDPFTFIKIAEKIILENANIKFIYIGDGVLKHKVECEILKNNLQSNILLLGFRNDVDDILKIFDIYIITSLYEGLPYSLIEALRAKLPIIATDTIGNNEIVFNEFNGLLFEVGNVEDGVNKVRNLLYGRYNINLLKENSYKLFVENFGIEKMIEKIQNIYRKEYNH